MKPTFTRENLEAIFYSSFQLTGEEQVDIFPAPPEGEPLPDTFDTIVKLVNDEATYFNPTTMWYTEMTNATCPLAVWVGSQPTARPEVILEIRTYAARLTLSRVTIDSLIYDEQGPWVVLTIDVGRGAPLSYLV